MISPGDDAPPPPDPSQEDPHIELTADIEDDDEFGDFEQAEASSSPPAEESLPNHRTSSPSNAQLDSTTLSDSTQLQAAVGTNNPRIPSMEEVLSSAEEILRELESIDQQHGPLEENEMADDLFSAFDRGAQTGEDREDQCERRPYEIQ